MDIRTLLTETKPFPLKRKSTSLSPSPSFNEKQESPGATYISPVSVLNAALKQSPITPTMKKVKFTFVDADSESPASLELNVSPTDPPSAITGTVKDFFALHEGGVSFTDAEGSILIVTPDNLFHGMEVYVNRVHGGIESTHRNKKKRKLVLSSRKKTRRISIEKDIEEVEVEEDEVEIEKEEPQERKEKILSSDVSIENIILDSSRRRLSKFSSEHLPLIPLEDKGIVAESTTKGPSRPHHLNGSPRDFSFRQPPLPTPTPTSASVISDEDVAIQLMRLTDPLATPILSPSVVDEAEEKQSNPDTEIQTTPTTEPAKEGGEHSRCTRCITSKKGCDRKRPCSRCVQQGYEEWECASDDERGTARKKIAAIRRTVTLGKNVGRPRKQ